MAGSRPRIILSSAMSIDGKIATSAGDSKLSSESDIRRVHKLRSGVDAILVGKKTVERDDPLLSVRYVRGRNPTRIVIDSLASTPSGFRIIKTAKDIPTIIACTEKASERNRQRLQRHSVEVVHAGKNSVNLGRLLSILYKRGIRTVLLEGGGRTNWEFVRRNLVDEIIITVSPRVLGGAGAVSLVDGAGFSRISRSPRFRLEKAGRRKDELVLRYTKL